MAEPSRTEARRDEIAAPSARDAARTPATAAPQDPGTAAEVPLHVLGHRDLVLRSRRRKAARLTVFSVAVLVAASLVVAGAQALIAEHQVRLDALQQQLSSAVTTNQSLGLTRATLGSPDRILAVAEHQLKMVSPGTVRYLEPVDPGPSVAEVAQDGGGAALPGGAPRSSADRTPEKPPGRQASAAGR
jgi:cell division protein FtsL